jgi:hypothetical protein
VYSLQDVTKHAIYKQLCGGYGYRRIRDVTTASACVDEILGKEGFDRGSIPELFLKIASFFLIPAHVQMRKGGIVGHTLVGAFVYFDLPPDAHLMVGTLCGDRGPILFDSNYGEFPINWTEKTAMLKASIAANARLMTHYPGADVTFRYFIHLPNDYIARHSIAIPC